ncbi:flagellar assembly protein FliW [Natroniella sp. ANB-PHB2]|uniref:flagellar assembly protein FliW n=1 Tax=Natroniella sp. ANB-PHB2 TaxID=3384444 RepID=UPI0038D3FBC5
MKVKTELFGEIEISEDKIITFAKSILGFEEYTKFTIIDSLDDDLFYWLQSLEEPGLSFIMINPVEFVSDYKVSLTDKVQERLEITQETSEEDIIIYTLVVVENDGERIRTNLKAPLVINAASKKAGQIVLEAEYPTRYYLSEAEKKEEFVG